MDPVTGIVVLGALGAIVGIGKGPTRIPGAGGEGWVWPMLRLGDGRAPVVSDGFGSDRDGGSRSHKGVDVMYKRPRTWSKEEWAAMSAAQRNHNSRGFEVPEGAFVVCARAGRVWSSGRTELGHHVIVDHGRDDGIVTFYQHLESLAIPGHSAGKREGGAAGMEVEAGTVLGTCGYSRRDAASIRHLHFEVRTFAGGKMAQIDPERLMASWRVLG